VADDDRPKPSIPTGWAARGAKLAGQTGKSAARFLGTRARAFAAPDRAQEFLGGFHEQTAQHLVGMLGEMKGAAMKVGQLASFYEVSIPGEYADTYRDALTMLQNSAPPMDPEASKAVIKEEFGKPVNEVFATFEEEAVAAASIGQVHRATLHSGETVAVKVQYPGVDQAIRSDLKNINAMTKLSVAIAPNMDPREVANEVRDRILEELDYRREAANQRKFSQMFEDHPFIYVPAVYPEMCKTRVIVQEFVEGESFVSAFDWKKAERDRLGEMVFRFFWGCLNRFRLFSADPHPGNYLLMDDGRVAFLDFGLVRAIDPGTRASLVEVLLALINDDRERGRKALEALGILSRRTPEVEAIWEHLKLLNGPVLVDKKLKITREMVQEIAGAFDPRSPAFSTLRKVGMPGTIMTLNRMTFGVASLLARLESTANWQRISREYWFGEESRTELGAAEQEWLAKVHPDIGPLLPPE
jgi:predicted unusual protein kinase regulating ubiquinone biosynthesis (AarF/ABC1/UbiB family)